MPNDLLRTSIFCSNLEASLALYSAILGLEIIEQKDLSGAGIGALVGHGDCRMRIAYLRGPSGASTLGLFELSGAPVKRLTPELGRVQHGQVAIVLSVSDCRALEARVREAGYSILVSALDTRKAVATSFSPAGIYREMIFYDPDHVLVSLIEYLPLDGAAA